MKKMAVTLYYLSSSGTFREATVAMGMSKSWVIVCMNSILDLIARRANEFIHLPRSKAQRGTVMDAFFAHKGLPYVCGAVDGTIIEIARPKCFEGWYCRRVYPAINVHAVVNYQRTFISFDMRPGSYSDQKIWRASLVGSTARQVLPTGCHYIGDGGYALSCELLTPYQEQDGGVDGLNDVQNHYNYILSSTRMSVECAFGMLKNRL